ncbi:streptogramin lyase [Synechococcus sp. PCC 6312]|uniref:Vgb family protein n=1 Tax=Synechococcus sp. (strain ATCC 27167 / PCC 6312) TaxID=195253 RepID=UPI00029ED933|nr:streptogramin lyase [Synechococcus sp. PCC 6312]AFY62634.1 streptogramin lyase [Synechococcus sp. PCC 6312]
MIRAFSVSSLLLSLILALPVSGGSVLAAPVPATTYKTTAIPAPDAIGNDASRYKVTIYPTVPGMGTRDVAPDPDGSVWFNGQWSGVIGHLIPATGEVKLYPLGRGSHPHGVIMGPDGYLWICDEVNAIVRFDRKTHEVKRYNLPPFPHTMGYGNLNTPVFDGKGILWFTAQNGYYGRLDPRTGDIKIFPAPLGYGPYGMTATPKGDVWYTSLAGNYIARINTTTFLPEVFTIPERIANGSRRIWSDSQGNIWITTWGTGALMRFNPVSKLWDSYKLPGLGPRGYSTYVDNQDKVWSSDFGTNSIHQFDPVTNSFTIFPGNKQNVQTLQMNGVGDRIWAGQQGVDQIVLFERIK